MTFFRIGVILAILNSAGTTAVCIDLLKMMARDGAKIEANCFNSKGRMPSGPGDLNGSYCVSKVHTDSTDTSAKLLKSSSVGGPHGNF